MTGADGVTERPGVVQRAGQKGWRGRWQDWGGGLCGRQGSAQVLRGESYRVVCYLSTSDQSHLLQGEAEEVGGGGQGAVTWKKNCEKMEKKKGADMRSKFVFHILVLIGITYCVQACPFF